MSRLRELIDELCPDGVEYKTLGEVAPFVRERANTGEAQFDAYVGVDALLQNKMGRDLTKTDIPEGRHIYFKPGDTLLGNIRPYLQKVWFADCSGGTNGDVLVFRAKEDVDPKYLFYVISSDDFFVYDNGKAKGSKMPRGDKEAIRKYRLPVPPIEVQREIVRILDSFQELDDALTAEIDAREKQYSILTRRLLSREYLETVAGGPIVQKPLKEIALVGSSKRVLKRDLVDSGIPFFRGTEVGLLSEGNPIDPQLFLTEETYASVVSSSGKPLVGDLLLPSVNEAGKVWMVDTDDAFYLKDARVLWVHTGNAKEEVDCRYMRYALSKSLVDNYRMLASGSQFAELKISSLETAPILLPPFGVQSMVADKLDDARALLQDRTIGLPAERDARRKQFEHYRDRLLAFPEKVA